MKLLCFLTWQCLRRFWIAWRKHYSHYCHIQDRSNGSLAAEWPQQIHTFLGNFTTQELFSIGVVQLCRLVTLCKIPHLIFLPAAVHSQSPAEATMLVSIAYVFKSGIFFSSLNNKFWKAQQEPGIGKNDQLCTPPWCWREPKLVNISIYEDSNNNKNIYKAVQKCLLESRRG